MANVDLTVSANIAGLRAELEKIPDITKEQARQMMAELNKSIQESTRFAKKQADETAAAYRNAGNAGQQAMQQVKSSTDSAAAAQGHAAQATGKNTETLQKLAAAADIISPALGGAARGAADLAEAGTAISAMGPYAIGAIAGLTVAAGAFGAAVALMNEYLEDERQKMEAAAQASDQLASAKLRVEMATIDLAVAMQTQTQAEAEANRIRAESKNAIDGVTTSIRRQIYENNIAIETNKAYDETWFGLGGAVRRVGQEFGYFGQSTDELTAANARLQEQARSVAEQMGDERDLRLDIVEVLEYQREEQERERASAERRAKAEAESARRRADAERRKAEAERRAAELERAREQSAKDLAQMTLSYEEGIRDLTSAQKVNLSEEEQIIEAGEERLRQLEELAIQTRYNALTSEQAARAEAEAELARVAIREDVTQQLADLEDQRLEAEKQKRKQAAEEEKAQNEEMIAERRENAIRLAGYASEAFSMVSGLFEQSSERAQEALQSLEDQLVDGNDTLTQAEKEALKERIEAQRQAAMRSFELQKTAKLAEATVSGAAAVVQALASSPPPFNAIAAGLTAAATAAQLATIASAQPAFHSGGMVPDETQARLLTGEAVLSRTGRSMIGDDQINRANAGMSGGSRPMVVVQQYRHRVYNDFIRDNLRIGGNLADAIRGTRTVGMREAL